MERRPCGSNRDSMSRRIPYRNTEELGIDNKDNRRSTEKNKEAIQQEKAESSRTKGQRQCCYGTLEH